MSGNEPDRGDLAVPYPADREVDVSLRDGSLMHLRPVRAGDVAVLRSLFENLSQQSRVFRFFSAAANLHVTAQRMAEVDYVGRYGLVASRGKWGKPIAHGTYLATSPVRAEIAFAVADELQGLGLATLLLAHLAEVARDNDVATFFAEVLPGNHHMIEVFEDSGFSVVTHSYPDAIRIEFPTALSAAVIERFGQRERIAAEGAAARYGPGGRPRAD